MNPNKIQVVLRVKSPVIVKEVRTLLDVLLRLKDLCQDRRISAFPSSRY